MKSVYQIDDKNEQKNIEERAEIQNQNIEH